MSKRVIFGCIIWAMFAIWFGYDQSIKLLLSFSILVLFPLVTELTYREKEKRDWFITLQPLFSILGAGSLFIETASLSGTLAFCWLLFTCWVACIGIARASSRGFVRMEENAIDAAYVYMILGGLWLFLSQAGIEGLPFSPVIVLLTAVHFHYSSLIVPIVVGLVGRCAFHHNVQIRGYGLLAGLLMIGPLLVGIGITIGGLADFLFVGIYVFAMFWLAFETFRVLIKVREHPLARTLILTATLISVAAMVLSAFYSAGVSVGTVFITIDQMVLYHGYAQAFGYSFLILIGWAFIKPRPLYSFGQFRLSRLRGKWRVGDQFLQDTRILNKNETVDGLVESFTAFERANFSPIKVDPSIRKFYEQTNHYEMSATTRWHGIYYPLSRPYHWVTGKIGQLYLRAATKHPKPQRMEAVIYPIDETIDGRHPVRAWIRKDYETKEEIFVAFYAYYATKEKTYMDIALPLPYSVMTGILRPQHDESDGLILTSFREPGSLGDEGVYVTIGKWTIRVPIEEYFHVRATEDPGRLTAVHELHFFGLRCLTIDYEITCKLSKQL
ncbi:YndJ family protein [Alkalicoccobacillus gibsonii]|uniref:YndJ family protein n=1 Tax=Alkalicoccobacillus gibsonii TaxID=79881 RepID=UPI0035170FEE